MSKKAALVFALATTLGILAGLYIAKADDAPPPSKDNGLPRLEVAKEYELPASKSSSGIAAFLVGDTATAVVWSPDGKEIAAFSSYGQNLTVWDAASGNVINVLHPGISYLNNSLVFLNDDELLVQAEGTRGNPARAHVAFDIWNVKTGTVVRSINGPEPDKSWGPNTPYVYNLSPDGTMLVMLAQQTGMPQMGPAHLYKENPIPVYSTKTWDILQRIPLVAPASVAFSPDGKQVAFGQHTWAEIFIYDTATWKLVKSIPVCKGYNPTIETMAYSPDGEFIAAGMTTYVNGSNPCGVKIMRVADGAVVGTYPDHLDASPWKILWHPGGKFIVFAPHGKTLRLWNPNKPDDIGTTIPTTNSMCLAFSPDGNQLAACNNDRITVFNIDF